MTSVFSLFRILWVYECNTFLFNYRIKSGILSNEWAVIHINIGLTENRNNLHNLHSSHFYRVSAFKYLGQELIASYAGIWLKIIH
jgi:hypothetical protein